MEEKKIKIGLTTLIIIAVITIIVIGGFLYIYIEKVNENNKATNIVNNEINHNTSIRQNTTNNKVIGQNSTKGKNTIIDNTKQEKTKKVLVEYYSNHSGMPGPNGGTDTGTSTFIASDGIIYEYSYDEYNDETEYPKMENIQELSNELISKARKTDKKLTEEELKTIEECIYNIENGKEQIDEITITPAPNEEPIIADSTITKTLSVYNYNTAKKINIETNEERGSYYTSTSIKKIFDITQKYIEKD